MVTVRPYAPGDDLALNDLLADPTNPAQHMLRALIREDSDSSPVTRTVVAQEDAGVLVGAAVCAEAPVHPGRAWFHVEVAPQLVGQEGAQVTQALADALAQSVAGTVLAGLPLRTRVGVSEGGEDDLGEGIVAPGGGAFSELFCTRLVQVETLALGGLGADRADDFVVTATGSVELTRAFARWYAGVNRADPVAEMSLGEVNRRFLSEAAGAHGAALWRRGGEVSAFAVSYPRGEGGSGEAGSGDGATELTVGVMVDASNPMPAKESAEFQAALGDAGALVARLTTDADVVVEVTSEMPVLSELLDGLISAGKARVIQEYATLGT